MLRVTPWKVWVEKDAVQSSLSKSGEISRVDAVLELSHADYARQRGKHDTRYASRSFKPLNKRIVRDDATIILTVVQVL